MIFPENHNTCLEPSEPINQKSYCETVSDKIKDAYGKTKSFAKGKPIIFGLICLGCISLLIITIAVPIALSKNKKNSNPVNSPSQDPVILASYFAQDACSNDKYSDECLYQKMIAKKSEYPEGMPWTNDNFYAWKGGIYSGGYGCAGFAFMLSDVCFGDIKATQLKPCPSQYKVGDVVRINNDTHFVIILKIDSATKIITIAEGNYNSAIHWGRTFTTQNLGNTCNYILRRNPK